MEYAEIGEDTEGRKEFPTFYQNLGDRIRAAVEIVGLDKSVQVSRKSAKTIGRYIAGSEPPFGVVVALAEAAGVSISWLASGNELTVADVEAALRVCAYTAAVLQASPEKTDDLQELVELNETRTAILRRELELLRRNLDDSSVENGQSAERTEQEQDNPVRHLDPKLLDADRMVLLPLLDVQASAGTGLVAHQEEVSAFVAFSESYLRELGVNPRFAHILQISGRSMWPTLDDRDWVVVDRSIDVVIDEALYAVVYGGLVLVKRVRLARDGTVTLSSDNKADGYEDEQIAPADLHTLHVVGRVKAHCRAMS